MAIATTRLTEVVNFYEQLFTKAPHIHRPLVYAEFALPGMRLAIFHPQLHHQAEFMPIAKGSMSICLEVEDLESAIHHLANMGYPPTTPIISASHGREIYAYDPIGDRLILHESKKSLN